MKKKRIEFSVIKDNPHLVACDCFEGDKFVTTFIGHKFDFPMKSENIRIEHQLFSFALREAQ